MDEMQQLLQRTVDMKASDLHISAGSPVMLRVRGSMKNLNAKPISQETAPNTH